MRKGMPARSKRPRTSWPRYCPLSAQASLGKAHHYNVAKSERLHTHPCRRHFHQHCCRNHLGKVVLASALLRVVLRRRLYFFLDDDGDVARTLDAPATWRVIQGKESSEIVSKDQSCVIWKPLM